MVSPPKIKEKEAEGAKAFSIPKLARRSEVEIATQSLAHEGKLKTAYNFGEDLERNSQLRDRKFTFNLGSCSYPQIQQEEQLVPASITLPSSVFNSDSAKKHLVSMRDPAAGK